VGVWIETVVYSNPTGAYKVTPFVGVWIETLVGGLFGKHNTVTPFVGVWIETANICPCCYCSKRHTLRGCVDWNCKW